MRLLVVEDDNDLNRQIAAALSQAGYAVDRAFDGEEGWFLGDTEPYDAVVLDLGLPKKDGISILGEWRRAGRLIVSFFGSNLRLQTKSGFSRFVGS
jgi:two-component system, OmpR family, response regulator